MIHNKSTHPVEIKRILVRMWTLRDEIEAAIARRISECESSGIPLYVEDIKNFYGISPSTPLNEVENVTAQAGDINQTMEDLANVAGTIGMEKSEEQKEESNEAPSDEQTPSTENNPIDSLNQAEDILKAQADATPAEKSEKNPIIDRPFVRTAPDLSKISYGLSMLSDIHMEEALIFTKNHFTIGQTVVVEFLIPNSFMLTAEVRVCNNIALKSKIISETKPNFRAQCRFKFFFSGERGNLRQFLVSIEPSVNKNLKAKKGSDAGDESVAE